MFNRRQQPRTPPRRHYGRNPAQQINQQGGIPQPNTAEVEANGIAKKANNISWLSIIINVAIAVATFMLFALTKSATQAAIDSAATADSALRHQFIRDSLSDIANSLQHKEDSLNNRKRFVLDSTSIQAQIDAFKEDKRRFEIQNEAFLQMVDFSYDTSTSKGFTFIKMKIGNLNSYPAKIIGISQIVLENEITDYGHVSALEGPIYVTKESTYDIKIFHPVFSLRNSYQIYLAETIEYVDLVSKKTKRYQFQVYAHRTASTPYRYIKNENTQISN